MKRHTMHRFCTLLCAAGTAAMLLLTVGCVSSRSSAPRVTRAVTGSSDFDRGDTPEKIGPEELDELTNAYADRYRTLMEDAVAEIIKDNPNATQRAMAQRFLVETTTSAYDIATNGDPFSQVLDLTIMVTLTSQVWIDGDRATVEFERRAQFLVDALRQAREEVWAIAARVLLPDQLAALDFMIAGWRRDNATVQDVSFVRFDDFAQSRGRSLVADARSGGGLFQPINQAVDEAVAYRKLLERIFFLAKRSPTLVNWQAQSVVDQVLAKNETVTALENLANVSQTADQLGKTVSKLVEDVPKIVERERLAVVAEIDRRQKDIDGALADVKKIAQDARAATTEVRSTVASIEPTLKEARTTLDAAQPTLAAVERLAATAERILGKVADMSGPPDPNAKPFDIAEYRGALADATATLVEANKALDRGETLAGSPAVKGLIKEVTDATEARIHSLETTLWRLIWLVGGIAASLLVLAFALAVAYRRLGGGATT